jgi:hypothetical protein
MRKIALPLSCIPFLAIVSTVLVQAAASSEALTVDRLIGGNFGGVAEKHGGGGKLFIFDMTARNNGAGIKFIGSMMRLSEVGNADPDTASDRSWRAG